MTKPQNCLRTLLVFKLCAVFCNKIYIAPSLNNYVSQSITTPLLNDEVAASTASLRQSCTRFSQLCLPDNKPKAKKL